MAYQKKENKNIENNDISNNNANETINEKVILKENNNGFDNEAIMKMMSSFQEQLNLMKEQNDKLREENEILKNKAISNDDDFDPNKLVTIRNMYDGLELNLKIDDYGRIKKLTKLGGTIKVRLLEAKDIVRLNQKFAEKGYFIFDDMKIVEKEFDELIDCYNKVINYKVLNQIQNLELKDLKSVFKNANERYQRMILDKFITEWTKGEDIKFRDQAKINLLSEISGVDMMAQINGVESDDNLKNEFIKK